MYYFWPSDTQCPIPRIEVELLHDSIILIKTNGNQSAVAMPILHRVARHAVLALFVGTNGVAPASGLIVSRRPQEFYDFLLRHTLHNLLKIGFMDIPTGILSQVKVDSPTAPDKQDHTNKHPPIPAREPRRTISR
jgi:hypothetical protein